MSDFVRDEQGRRKCSRCRDWKEDKAFGSRTSGYCTPCQAAYRREKYVPARDRYGAKPDDPRWRAHQAKKTCFVCQKKGGEVEFRALTHKRCHDCMSKGLHRCKRCSHVRRGGVRCGKCQYQKDKARRLAQHEAYMARGVRTIRGDGTCFKCGQRVKRAAGVPIEKHECPTLT